jgi:endoglucanase
MRRCVVTALVLLAAGCDEGGRSCADGEINAGGECILSAEIDIGMAFIPDRAKRATLPGPASPFAVLREDGSIAFEGTTIGPLEGDTGVELSVADFSPLRESGAFQLKVPGVGNSVRFRIAPDAYNEALRAVLLGLHGQRCGAAVHFSYRGSDFSHGECHKQDAWMDYVGRAEVRPSLGGWHDAGDYGKYTVNGAFSAAMMLKAWEHFGAQLNAVDFLDEPSELPDFLAEVAWQLEWLLSVQLEDGRASHKVTAQNFESLEVAPHEDSQKRYYAPAGTAPTASLVAVLAQAARVYETLAPDLAARSLDSARRGWAYLAAHPEDQKPDLSAFKTGGYGTDDPDDRLWAAAELWETTGEAEFLTAFELQATGRAVRLDWDWSNLANLGLFTYLESERAGRNPELVAALEQSALGIADEIVGNAERHAYGRGVGSKYYWGINGVVARTVMNLQVAYRLDARPEYLDAAVQQVDHVLGRNHYGRSQVTGVGHHPPLFPHHRPSVADTAAAPWPGLLVGGAHPTPSDWVDESTDYRTNEVAINWSTALIYALAGFLP